MPLARLSSEARALAERLPRPRRPDQARRSRSRCVTAASCASATSPGSPERAENLVSHHLRALRAAGLADYRRDGKMALYSLTERGRALLDALAARRRLGVSDDDRSFSGGFR